LKSMEKLNFKLKWGQKYSKDRRTASPKKEANKSFEEITKKEQKNPKAKGKPGKRKQVGVSGRWGL